MFNKEEISWIKGSMNGSSTFIFKGDKPKSGSITIDENGNVQMKNLVFSNYKCNGGSKTKVVCIENNGQTSYKSGTEINYNPVTNQKCTKGTDGCMKWYVIGVNEDDSTKLDIILDHNTTEDIGLETALIEVMNDTSEWHSDIKITARLINANEVAKITGADKVLGWNSSNSSSDWFYLDGSQGIDAKWQTRIAKNQGTSKYAWLYSNLYECEKYGCNVGDASGIGYWTKDIVSGSDDLAWFVSNTGALANESASGWMSNMVYTLNIGVRPVITISQDILE